jgi:hypothetical protein
VYLLAWSATNCRRLTAQPVTIEGPPAICAVPIRPSGNPCEGDVDTGQLIAPPADIGPIGVSQLTERRLVFGIDHIVVERNIALIVRTLSDILYLLTQFASPLAQDLLEMP